MESYKEWAEKKMIGLEQEIWKLRDENKKLKDKIDIAKKRLRHVFDEEIPDIETKMKTIVDAFESSIISSKNEED